MKLKKRNKSVAVSEIKMVSNNESLNEKKKLILEIITFEVWYAFLIELEVFIGVMVKELNCLTIENWSSFEFLILIIVQWSFFFHELDLFGYLLASN